MLCTYNVNMCGSTHCYQCVVNGSVAMAAFLRFRSTYKVEDDSCNYDKNNGCDDWRDNGVPWERTTITLSFARCGSPSAPHWYGTELHLRVCVWVCGWVGGGGGMCESGDMCYSCVSMYKMYMHVCVM